MTPLFIPFIIFLFGLIVGSFLNVVINRLSTKETLWGYSHCPHCRHRLGFFDLFPLLSFIFLQARCRYCHKPISWQYPLVELTTGLAFLLAYLQFPVDFYFYWFFSAILIVIFVYDLKHYLILDKVIFPALIITIIINFIRSDLTLAQAIIGSLSAGLFFLALVLFSRGKWMGGGDAKFAFLMGLMLGYPNIIVALALSFIVGAIVGLLLIALGRKKMKSQLPFGTFLSLFTFITFFFGSFLIKWYLEAFLGL